MENKIALKFENFFDPENDLVCVTRNFEKYEFISLKWEEVLGRSLKEINEMSLSSHIHPDDWDSTAAYLSSIKTKTSGSGFINRYLTKDRKVKWLQWRIFSSSDSCIGLATDITEMKFNLEEEKRKTIQATKLATLGEMAAGLAHEVNNPLTIIFGYVRVIEEEMANKTLDYEKFRTKLGLIKLAAERAAKIVNNLKDFARDGSSDPYEEVLISQIISTTLDLCQERFKKSGIHLEVLVDDDPIVFCRKIEISQVILNLLSNAFDAVIGNQNKWVKINITLSDDKVLITVSDSGKPMMKEVVEKLFQPFFTTKKRGLGTGLGLSISQRIVSYHSGEIFFDPAAPNTSFVIKLPLNRET